MQETIQNLASDLLKIYHKHMCDKWPTKEIAQTQPALFADIKNIDDRGTLHVLYHSYLASMLNQSAELLQDAVFLEENKRASLLPSANRAILERLSNVIILTLDDLRKREEFLVKEHFKNEGKIIENRKSDQELVEGNSDDLSQAIEYLSKSHNEYKEMLKRSGFDIENMNHNKNKFDLNKIQGKISYAHVLCNPQETESKDTKPNFLLNGYYRTACEWVHANNVNWILES